MKMRQVEVLRGSSAEHACGHLNPALSAGELGMAEMTWAESRQRVRLGLMEGGVPHSEWPESLHWDWMAKTPLLRRLEVRGSGVLIDDAWQGLMLTKSASHMSRLDPDRGKPLIYVDYVEVAPWNWNIPALGQTPRFRGLGSLLVAEAVRQSFAEGFAGRVGLHSLPQAEGFYAAVIRMTPVERDSAKQNLLYFELSRENARLLLDQGMTR